MLLTALTCAACGTSQHSVAPANSLLAAVKFTHCMRAHDVPMLDPGPQGNTLYDAPTTPVSVISRAQSACNHFLPPAVEMTPQQHTAVLAKMVKFVRCMSEHRQPVQLVNRGGLVGYALPVGGGIDPKSQFFKTAEAACMRR